MQLTGVVLGTVLEAKGLHAAWDPLESCFRSALDNVMLSAVSIPLCPFSHLLTTGGSPLGLPAHLCSSAHAVSFEGCQEDPLYPCFTFCLGAAAASNLHSQISLVHLELTLKPLQCKTCSRKMAQSKYFLIEESVWLRRC